MRFGGMIRDARLSLRNYEQLWKYQWLISAYSLLVTSHIFLTNTTGQYVIPFNESMVCMCSKRLKLHLPEKNAQKKSHQFY